FAGGAVHLGADTHSVTVEDCKSRAPISEQGGYRRHTYFTLGQLALFNRCWSEHGRHDFSIGHAAAGPNVFLQCRASEALASSGPLESWASGVLFDNVRIDGHNLELKNRWNWPPGAGWSAANCVLWQCRAAGVECYFPPGETNWAIGCWATHAGDGAIEAINDFVKPHSLYQAQLRDRIGDSAAKRCEPLLGRSIASTSPTYDEAAEFVRQSIAPARKLVDLIEDQQRVAGERVRNAPPLQAVAQESISDSAGATTVEEHSSLIDADDKPLTIRNGWLVEGFRLKTGDRLTPSWWRGMLRRQEAMAMGPNISRFAPGRWGDGRTNDLIEIANRLAARSVASYEHHYGLWYDRRRDDHLMVRRTDGNVQPPFYEQPFRRTGRGTSWDGLSKYDLTSDNPWYWNRLRDFALLCDARGMLLVHHNYFQHNILEAGAHWVDSPWRPANNVNTTGLPEPPPFIGDKRIFMAKHFYDVSNPNLRALHRRYIRQCLSAFADCANVLQLTSAEYTGPLHFMQFWLDIIAEWEVETGNEVLIGLSCTKDVQDAILADTVRRKFVDVIDIRYWTYDANFEPYAPPGGRSMAPRQHMRQMRPKASSFAAIARAVAEHRTRFPEKAVLYNADRACSSGRDGWAVLMGGGSLPNITLPPELAKAIPAMRPVNVAASQPDQWRIESDDGQMLIYSESSAMGESIRLPSPQRDASYIVRWINPESGAIVAAEEITSQGGERLMSKSNVIWITPAN
ncbi:DUF6298 domain-containing protein, partial [Pirellulales bacterium]|nr:DUF6298 domain-containing protein [Pirellulales bacterium]